MYIQNSITILSLAGVVIILTSLIVSVIIVTVGPVQAETGQGADVFRVIMTIFGVDESKGDVIAIVTAKDEAARVKLFDASGPEVVPLNASEGGGHLIEYIATFPNLTINSGEEYRACVATVKDLELICKTGNNSPATRPEFVDLSLNATSDGIQQTTVIATEEEEDSAGEGQEDADGTDETELEAEEGEDMSPGIPTAG
ncbi:MAG TPA: hypothetical protein VKA91_09065 [Nitrososphaeraceae archaeon]|nr:hypothetical protein [Nitrososphaeraceae archaeon]